MRYRLKRGDVLDIKSLRKVASVLYKATPSQYYEIEKLQLWVNTQTCIKSSTLRDNVITKHLPDMISEGVDTFYVQRLRRIHKRKNKSAVSLYFWVLKYGKSKGVYLYKQYNKSRKVTLEDSIRRYGEDVGRKKYNDYVNKQKKNGVTLEWFQEQYGMIEGLAKYKDIGRRKAHTISSYIERYGNEEEALYKLLLFWSKRNTGRFFSDSSQRLCRDVDNLHIFDSYFATKNVEYGIYDNIMHRYFMYDYTIPELRLILEFHGDHWHANPSIYKPSDTTLTPNKRKASTIWMEDRLKRECANRRGFEVIYVWESTYNSSPDSVLFNIKEFIQQRCDEIQI